MHPILFQIGSFKLHSFGAAMVFAFLAGIFVAQRRAARYGFALSQIGDLSFWVLLAGILGARIVYIAQEYKQYSNNWKEVLTLQFQGLTSFGGLIFGGLAGIAWSYRNKLSPIALLDLLTPAFLVGHAIGRIGCLLNGCCFGGRCPATLPWGIHVQGTEFLHHPAQVYDSAMNLAVLGFVLWIERKNLKAGQILGLGLGLHGLTRFIYEFWRAGTEAQVKAGAASSTYWGGLPITQAQGMAAVLILLGLLAFFWPRRPVLNPGEADN